MIVRRTHIRSPALTGIERSESGTYDLKVPSGWRFLTAARPRTWIAGASPDSAPAAPTQSNKTMTRATFFMERSRLWRPRPRPRAHRDRLLGRRGFRTSGWGAVVVHTATRPEGH